jgi:hypothetical protein
MNALKRRHPLARLVHGVHVFASDTVGGFWAITHHGVAVTGVLIVMAVLLIVSKTDLRQQADLRLAAWLSDRQQTAGDATTISTITTTLPQLVFNRATVADPHLLPLAQARLTQWIARKYQVAPEPVAALVSNSFQTGQSNRIDPALILAVMAVESSFNPFAQSTKGAQGLMQVMTRVHAEKYDGYGGDYAAFDPLSNLHVGVWVLRDCIDKAGSTAGGLRCYVGAADLPSDGGYVNKVLTEYARMQQVAAGHPPPPSVNVVASGRKHLGQAVAKAGKPKSKAPPVAVVAALHLQ